MRWNRAAYLAFLASSSSISALAMSPALCCRMTSTSERLSTRSRISSVRACSCWGVLGISMFSTSLATASMLSRSALSSSRWTQMTKMWVKASFCHVSALKFLFSCFLKKENHGKLPPPDLWKNQGVKITSQGETPLSGEAQQLYRPCWHSSLGSHLKMLVLSCTTLGGTRTHRKQNQQLHVDAFVLPA